MTVASILAKSLVRLIKSRFSHKCTDLDIKQDKIS